MLAAAAQTGCSEEAEGPRLDGKQHGEGIWWPDFWPSNVEGFSQDYYVTPADSALKDGAAGDGITTGDGSSGCSGPSGVSCSPSCKSDELCTEAKKGMCASLVTLSGPASDKAALVAVAMAYVKCMAKNPSADTLCATFDTCSMTGTLTRTMVDDWVCNFSQVSDFPSAASHTSAKEICACSFINKYRPNWKVKTIEAVKKGKVCLSYDKLFLWDELYVNLCSVFPPV